MNTLRPFGRTDIQVPAIWQEQADGIITAGDIVGLIVDATDLDRRGGDRIRQRVAQHGHPFDFLMTRGLLANDLKVGWPLHRLQRFRDEKLFRFTVVETTDVLEAEWIAGNAPVHGVVLVYEPDDLSARYRVFTAAANASVALIGRATTTEAAALHLGTSELTATLLAPDVTPPINPLSTDAIEALWQSFSITHAEPPKLRSGHPPDYGT